MAPQSRLIFVNLPVSDVDASKEFYGSLGFEFDPKFTDDTCACMIVAEQASYVMLLDRDKLATFTPKPVSDARESTQAIVCVSADDREGVDRLADAALAAGGTPAKDPTDYGFMYGRSFCDPDGHLWEVMWMSAEAVEAGPAEFEPQPA